MKWFCVVCVAVVILISCSNSNEFETGEIKAIKMLREAIIARSPSMTLLDTRSIITRKKIDEARIPVLFVELENGQNGTLTLYPGEGIGETWLGADGATITLENGIIKATRGMRNDMMGSTSSMPLWSSIKGISKYNRKIFYLSGDNQIESETFSCRMKKHNDHVSITIFNASFNTQKFVEKCINNTRKLENGFFVDSENIVRRSIQYHGPDLGYLLIERLDR